MNFQIVWMPRAVTQLADVWLAAHDQRAVTDAAHAIDLTLAVDADTVGRVVFDTVRQYTHLPLAVEFEADVTTRRVFVLLCWNTATGRPNATGN